MAEITAELADTLRGLATGRPSVVEGLLGLHVEGVEESGLDARTHALANVAALIGVGATAPEYAMHVDAALAAGASPAQVVGVLVAVAPHVGTSRIVAAAPALMSAFGMAPDEPAERPDS